MGTANWITFHDKKVNGEDTSYPLSPFLESWRAHIYGQHRADHKDFTTLFPGGRATVRKLLHDIL